MRMLLPYLLISASLLAGWLTSEWFGPDRRELPGASETAANQAAIPGASTATEGEPLANR